MSFTAYSDVARLLGIPSPTRSGADVSPLRLIERIEGGLPVESLLRIANSLAPNDIKFIYNVVPRATLNRRKAQSGNKLSADEGAKVTRIARVWSAAVDVWGSEESARAFLFRPHAMIEDKRPIDLVIQNELGAEMVLDILGRLKYGSAA